jgi:hypothetical protein
MHARPIADRHSSVSGELSGAEALEDLLRQTLGAKEGEPLPPLQRERFEGTGAWRIRVSPGSRERTVIAKRLSLHDGRVTSAVTNQWLPRVGLERLAVPILAATDPVEDGCVWHLYEDLGDSTLDVGLTDSVSLEARARKPGFLSPLPLAPVFDRTRAAVVALAEIHMRFADDALLEECRTLCPDLGVAFLETNVREAVRGLERLGSRQDLSPEQNTVRARLLSLIRPLARELPGRSAELGILGGSQTLLHGDINGSNVLVYSEGGAWRVRLIDWAHAGVGPISYDLSNFLLHFRPEDRDTILDWYTSASSPTGRWPTEAEWNRIFDTAERSRLACSVAWLAAAAVETPADWVFQKLRAVATWFELLRPVLPPSVGDQGTEIAGGLRRPRREGHEL